MGERSRHGAESRCSTAKFNWKGFDQCDLSTGRGVGDQCAIACEAMVNPSLLGHFHCHDVHMSPVFQQVIYIPHWKPGMQPRKDAFVLNCAGHTDRQSLWDCVRKMNAVRG